MEIIIKEFDKVDSMEWLLSIAHSEIGNENKIIYDQRLWNIGSWGTAYFIQAENADGDVLGRCILSKDNPTLYGLFVYPPYQNRGVGTTLVKYCYHKNNELKISTRSSKIKHILANLDFKHINCAQSEYSRKIEWVYYKNENSTTN